ncbi:hypothetical protein T552_03455 [Pneumocystis carinii B80]|uniref:Uncharacterized protein n=1 Tax=Pneumocystis carinii (strain B80) TaxID=1408658 RepID=A0A0W4ZB03_PNEC8|nr:hypothetical protein T552_03455 [Pneumocystis carinii B80]KTW25594.1 hypothetical protein T552_03455 [Pneumocystis carinii B80]
MSDQNSRFSSSDRNTSLKKPSRPINLSYRDGCMKILEELNYCRENTWYLPWKCVEERHGEFLDKLVKINKLAYEKCEYEAFKERVKKLKELESGKISD